MKVFDDAISDMSKGSGGRRKLQEEVVQTIDREVTKDEVVAALTSLTKSTDGQKAKFPDCLALFKYFDKNGDGVLDISELVALFKYAGFGIPLSNQLATALLLWYDKHPKDGVLSMKEIVAACKGGKLVEQVDLVEIQILAYQILAHLILLGKSPTSSLGMGVISVTMVLVISSL